MKRIRNLGLAVVAALALTASAGTASAGAAGFVAAEYPAGVDMKSSSTQTGLYLGGVSVLCDAPYATGELTKAGASITTTQILDPKCTVTSHGGLSATLELKGCKFIFHPIAPGSGQFDLGPPGCGPIVLNSSGWCDFTLSPTSNLPATYENQGKPSEVEVIFSDQGKIPFTDSCGGKGTATLHGGGWQLKAFNGAGAAIDLSVQRDGFFFNSGLFEAEAYPVSVSGGQDATNKHQLSFGAFSAKCTTANFASQVSGASAQLQVAAEYEGCTGKYFSAEFAEEIKMNSCGFVFSGAGTAAVSCAAEGDAIEVEIYFAGKRYCTNKIASQSGISSVSYSTVGSGPDRGVSVGLNLKGIKFTVQNTPGYSVCNKDGLYTGGSYTGSTTLLGPQ